MTTTNEILATKVMRWHLSPNKLNWCSKDGPERFVFDPVRPSPTAFTPDHDRHDLAEVIEKLTPEQWDNALAILERRVPAGVSWSRWLLTRSPAIIADAIAKVIEGGSQ